jgi:ubiquinone/menaquinone biosynthesis C-methylase UbiE
MSIEQEDSNSTPPGERSAAASKFLRFGEAIGQEISVPMEPGSRVFDLGSGAGKFVQYARDNGYKAYGADLYTDESLKPDSPFLEKIPAGTAYKLPFGNNGFDCAFSQNVLEHVSNLDETVAEVHRILKPGAWSLNLFPPRHTPIESQVFVPGGTIFLSYPYFLVWS